MRRRDSVGSAALLGVAHGVADGAAGLLLGGLTHTLATGQVAMLVLVYNLLAFGAQPLAGLIADRTGRPGAAAVSGLLLLAASLAATPFEPGAAVALAGLGSAFFHVGGGALACGATPDRAAGPGLFAAPGVLGLAIGGALAVRGGAVTASAPLAFGLLLAGLAAAVGLVAAPPRAPERTQEPHLDSHDVLMMLLLAAIALRSAVWTSLQFLLAGRTEHLLALAVAAMAGKALGGVLADRVGWRRWATGALAAAAPLLALGGDHLVTLLPGVFLLQSATPATLAAAARLMPELPATAAGLTLGLAVAAGGLYAMVDPSPPLALLAAGAALLSWLALRKGLRVWRTGSA